MNETNRPFIKYVDPQQFLVVQFMHIKRGEIVCPNCGYVSSIDANDFSALDTMEKREEYCRTEQFKMFLGLCSEKCCEEFLGGIYHVFKQR